jgi:hypothetical protein
MSCEHIPRITVGKDMRRAQSGFTLVEAMALIVVMALIVISATPELTARRLAASICPFPDSRRHPECFGTGKDPPTAKNHQ